MKFTRIPLETKLGTLQFADSFARNTPFSEESKIEGPYQVENFRNKILEMFPKDDGVIFRLEDEFSGGLIASLVMECRLMVSEDAMTGENWKAIGELLSIEIPNFSELKRELVKAERKCATVKHRAREISAKKSANQSFKSDLMACAMLLAEAEMRRDNLRARTAVIVEGFCALILEDFSDSASFTSLELRLRSVFGRL